MNAVQPPPKRGNAASGTQQSTIVVYNNPQSKVPSVLRIRTFFRFVRGHMAEQSAVVHQLCVLRAGAGISNASETEVN